MKEVPTDTQMADGLIKALKPDGYGKWLALIGPSQGGQGTDLDSEED